MSRNSKNRRKLQKAREMKGQTGPARTEKKNRKKNTWFARLSGKYGGPAPKKQEEEVAEA